MKEKPKIRGTLISKKKGIPYEFTYEYCMFYHSHLNANVYSFDIWREDDEIESQYRFSFMLRIMENGISLKVVDLFANHYKGFGISRAMILKSKMLFKKVIISCSNKFPTFSGEQNWKEAIEKVWEPMVVNGLAKYDSNNDIYYVL